MPLGPGRRLGPYEIIALLGVGGMGEVYRARDTILRRDVALKRLREPFSLDSDRLARFEREAQLLASLNHPNIASVYGLEVTAEAGHILVLELVEGPTLQDRIGQAAIDIPDALTIAKQVALAFEAAHSAGIIHRDLKPSNIKVRPDGTVKVLDFGIAKHLASGVGNETAVTTVSQPFQTQSGILLGTAPYMSPEQARGTLVDKRADIWSFGCVLYEMLTGTRAFGGATMIDTLAAVVGRDPDWSRLPAATPPPVQRLLRRCMEKALDRRIHDIADARIDIEDTDTLIGNATYQNWPSDSADNQSQLSGLPFWLALFLVPLAIGGLGFLINTAFNRTIGISDRFGWESPGDWLLLGLKSLTAPLLLVGMIGFGLTVARRAARTASKRFGPIRRVNERLCRTWGRIADTLRINDPLVLAQAVAIVGLLALVAMLWWFSDLIHAYWNPISEMLPEQLSKLGNDPTERNSYRIMLTSLVLALTFASTHVYRTRARLRVTGHVGWPRAGLVVLVTAVVMLELPYRVFYDNNFPKAELNGHTCYVIGENRLEFLLHCPAMELPRNRVVERGNPRFKTLNSRGSVYEFVP